MPQDPLPASLSEYEQAAEALLAPDLAAYFLRGSGAEQSLARNLSDLAELQLRPRVLRDLRQGHTGLTLFGQALAQPVLVAPMAFQTLLHGDGEAGTAAAATAQGAGMVLSLQAAQPMAHVRGHGAACQWMQLYWQSSRAATLALAQQAAEAGFRVLVLTVDAPVNGVRDAEIAARFSLPEGVAPVNLSGVAQPRFAPLEAGESLLFDRIAQVLPGWEDIGWLCEKAPLPVVLKGILHPEDAEEAVARGAAGVIVSNHGGRVLDGAISPITALPEVVARVGDAVPVLMDGGIRRGVDVLRALALGARAVLVGRPVVHGLAVAGAQGVSHVLRLLHDELEVAMALTGCRSLAEITPALIYRNR